MTTVGKQWRQALKGVSAAEQQESRAKERAEAEAIIATIPDLIAAATQEHVRVFGWISSQEVFGDDPNRVDKLSEQLHKEQRPLRASDLSGRAAYVWAWCDANDLECFLVSEKVPRNDYEYNFHVRPKP